MKKVFEKATPYILFYLFTFFVFFGASILASVAVLAICWACSIAPTIAIIYPSCIVGLFFATMFIITES